MSLNNIFSFFPMAFLFLSSAIISEAQSSFRTGEELEYQISYGFIKGGRASLKVSEKEINNVTYQHLVLKGKTTGITDHIYRVEDVYESFIYPESGLPMRSVRNIREQNYRHYEEVIHNQEYDYVISVKKGKEEVPNNTLDIVSAFYYLRNYLAVVKLKPEQVIRFSTYFAGDLFPLELRYKCDEVVKTKFGKIKCHKFMPVTEVGRVFKTEDDMTIWLSADENFVPVKVNFQIIVGSVNCDLVHYKNVVKPLNFK
jgi:hypothetical protein